MPRPRATLCTLTGPSGSATRATLRPFPQFSLVGTPRPDRDEIPVDKPVARPLRGHVGQRPRHYADSLLEDPGAFRGHILVQ
jgi:hypothetical protein